MCMQKQGMQVHSKLMVFVCVVLSRQKIHIPHKTSSTVLPKKHSHILYIPFVACAPLSLIGGVTVVVANDRLYWRERWS